MIETILAWIDGSSVQPPAVPAARRMGRRLLLAGATGGIALASFSCLTQASMVQPGLLRTAAPRQREPEPAPAWSISEPSTSPQSVSTMQTADHAGTPLSAEEQRDWMAFRARLIQPDGRVIDTFNRGESHTESQGLGMLFAVAFDDRASFDRIWSWTASHLRRPYDALFSWRYVPGRGNPVADPNNATDGDILIAAALLRAGSRWGTGDYRTAGQAIARDILALLVRDVGGRTLLLPGAVGFEAADHVEVNLSYYVFPLIAELQAAWPSPTWARLLDDGHRMVAEAQFGRWRLPPDWLRISARNGALALADRQPPRFSYDAVRIPLFMAWNGGPASALQRFAAFWGHNPADAPAWVDLKTDECAPYKACGGVVAIARLAGSDGGGPVPAITRSDDYYSAALILLSRLAMRETGANVARADGGPAARKTLNGGTSVPAYRYSMRG